MSATQAVCRGYAKTGPPKEASRLGSSFAEAEANTYVTFATVHMNADGSGWVNVKRSKDGEEAESFLVKRWGPEKKGDLGR